MRDRRRILFVCGRNQKRSPTAAAVFRNDPRIEVRSAGVSPTSRHRVTASDLRWADLVVVMERKHGQRIDEEYPGMAPQILSFDIADDYEFMDPTLVDLLGDCLEDVLNTARADDH